MPAAPAAVLTVDDLLSTASLNLTVLAGERGLGREVLWAHSCELNHPWQWLGPHEMLMTVGLCVPGDATEQRQFIAHLDEAGLAGLMIGDHETAPPLTAAMLDEANRRGFPVLLAATHSSYAVVARHVAAASSSAQLLQVLKLSKLYQVATRHDDEDAAMLRDLATLLGVGLAVADAESGLELLRADVPAPEGAALTTRRYPLRGAHPADLVLIEFPGEPLDGFLLTHLLQVLQVTVDRLLGALRRRVKTAQKLLTTLVNGGEPRDLDAALAPHRVAAGFRVVAFDPQQGPLIERTVALRRLPMLVGRGRTLHLALVPEALLPTFRDLAATASARCGVSSLFTDYRDVRTAAEEAARVHSSVGSGGRSWAEFEGTTISVLARSRREAEAIISGVLGPLAHETPTAEKLRGTLFTFLQHDRRWQETADALGIHRQTLSYRLNRIEAETGLSVSRSADLASLWIAYQAWQALR